MEHAHENHEQPSLNRSAFAATWHCLTGCAIGEVLGLVIATALGWGNAASIAIAIVLAFFFGYLLTCVLSSPAVSLFGRRRGSRLLPTPSRSRSWRSSTTASSCLSPGQWRPGSTTSLFWWSLAVGLVIAFWAAFPVNRALIARGRGHAVVHAYH